MDIYFKKVSESTMVVASEEDLKNFKKYKVGKEIKASITKARNQKFHGKYFALLGYAFKNQEEYTSEDAFRYEIAIQAGHYKWHATLNDKVYKIANSISFDKMDPETFERLYSSSIDIILKHFMHGSTREEIEQILGFD